MTESHQTYAPKHRTAIAAVAGLLCRYQGGVGLIERAFRRYRTLRVVAALPQERLRDCGIDPSLSEVEQTSPDEARLMLSLMSMR